MKTETPEKIYLVNDDINIKREWYKTKQVGFDTIEYIRTDAFIKKACAYVDSIGHRYIIDAFINYMKVEPKFNGCKGWTKKDEACFKSALWHITNSISNGKETNVESDLTEWFKSLKDRLS